MLYTWISSGDFSVNISALIDPLSCVMMLAVTAVGFLIHVYSIGYMERYENVSRYFAYLNLFMFSMLILVLAGNLLFMFVGWEMVGLCSYLLIGFWNHKPSASHAAKKAFVTNRVGDFGFLIGIIMLAFYFRSLDFKDILIMLPQLPHGFKGSELVTVITLLLFFGATGKSAQIPLYVWLPDAMEGPTPVSALIHAATMVTAGVYMICRLSALFMLAPFTLHVIAVVGAVTALFAATMALVQFDIKRILAYSTISQLGLMFLACGATAFSSGIFHLVTHAFFKALLFLGAGSIMHALSDETDIRKMGNLRKKIPATYKTFLVGALALAGIAPFSGFVSKDEILFETFINGSVWLWGVGILTSLLTSFYIFRVFFLVFIRPEPSISGHESPSVMTAPLKVLAVLSAAGGLFGLPFLHQFHFLKTFLSGVFPHHEVHAPSANAESAFMLFSFGIALLGVGFSYYCFIFNSEFITSLKRNFSRIYLLLLNKYYVDEIYERIFTRPLNRLSEKVLFEFVDVSTVDKLVHGPGAAVRVLGAVLSVLQNGLLRSYLFYFLLGVLVLFTLAFR